MSQNSSAPLHLQPMFKPILDASAWQVQAGPFQGMTISEITSWYGGHVVPKLVGSYEVELRPWIEEAIAASPDLIMNIGCGEGYYAVGLAMRLPAATVHAIDIDLAALRACEATAKANRLEGSLRLERGWSKSTLENLLHRGRKSLVLIDCEGCEAQLFREVAPEVLVASEIIVECHDFAVPGSSQTIQEVLAKTHEVRVQKTVQRKAEDFPLLAGYSTEMARLALSEDRPDGMSWIYAKPRF